MLLVVGCGGCWCCSENACVFLEKRDFELRIWQGGDDDDDDDDHYSSRITIMNTTHMKHCIGVHILVGGFNPILKICSSTWVHLPQFSG